MNANWTNAVVTFIRERNEFRVSMTNQKNGDRVTVGVCTVGGGFRAESEYTASAAPAAIDAVNSWLRTKLA
jgi:hypothetical protein